MHTIDFQKILLVTKKCEDHKGLQNHFVSLALLLPYLLHIVFLLKAINLCWYLCQASMHENIMRTYHSILMLILTLAVISVSQLSNKQKVILEREKGWKGHSTFFIQKAKFVCSKLYCNANLGTSIRLWIVVIFLFALNFLGTQWRMLSSIFSTRCSSKILYQNTIFRFKLHINLWLIK